MSNENQPISVIGLGYVGLPLACLFSRNHNVIGYEKDSEKVGKILSGEEVVKEPGLSELLSDRLNSGKLKLTSDKSLLGGATVKFITVGTPYDLKTRQTDFSQLDSSIKDISPYLNRGDVVALKSTVPPGTTDGRVKLLIESLGFKVPEEIGLVFSPERMVEGQAIHDFTSLPKIVGGSGEKSVDIIANILTELGGRVVKVSSAVTAEMVKMIDNYSRFVFIGLTNEIALMSEKLGTDIYELLNAAKEDYPRNSGLLKPGPGVGGSCLNKDPFILKSFMEDAGLQLKFVEAAKEVNYSMASHVVDITNSFSNGRKKVTIAGVAFKGDTNDTRFTTAFEIQKRLENSGYDTSFTDPYAVMDGVRIEPDLISASKNSEILVLLTDHSAYKKLDLKILKESMGVDPMIMDTRGIIDRKEAEKMGFEYHGLGRL